MTTIAPVLANLNAPSMTSSPVVDVFLVFIFLLVLWILSGKFIADEQIKKVIGILFGVGLIVYALMRCGVI